MIIIITSLCVYIYIYTYYVYTYMHDTYIYKGLDGRVDAAAAVLPAAPRLLVQPVAYVLLPAQGRAVISSESDCCGPSWTGTLHRRVCLFSCLNM